MHKIEPCPWCGSKAKSDLHGTYRSGWLTFVFCSNILHCGVRGPEKRTGGYSSEEYEIQDSVIDLWNSVIRKIKHEK